jgi:hypothetical protein
VDCCIVRIQSLCEQIALAGQTITDAERYFHLLHGLPTERENYTDIIMETIPDFKDWKAIIPKLETKESQLKRKKRVSPILLFVPPAKIDEDGETEMAIKMPTMQIPKSKNLVRLEMKTVENVNSMGN